MNMQQKLIAITLITGLAIISANTPTAFAQSGEPIVDVAAGVGLGHYSSMAVLEESNSTLEWLKALDAVFVPQIVVSPLPPTEGTFCFVTSWGDMFFVGQTITTHYHEQASKECNDGGFVTIESMSETLLFYEGGYHDVYVYHFLNGATIENANTAEEDADQVAKYNIELEGINCSLRAYDNTDIQAILKATNECKAIEEKALAELEAQ